MNEAPSQFWIVGAWLAADSRTAVRANLAISSQGRIECITHDDPPESASRLLRLENHLILPGLINSHDHLEFNLFPRLGRGPYVNYSAWAHDICRPDKSPVRDHLAVPKSVRLWWGGLKNLLSGVTTVCHHNPYDAVFENGFPVQVVRRYGWAHSILFEKDVHRMFAATDRGVPFIIHAGEGTDRQSRDELYELDRIGVLDRRTILVHGVAFSNEDHALREQRGAALVWCPTSNRFILGTTLDFKLLSSSQRIALGSDSALTGQGNLLDEIRVAHHDGVPADNLYTMVGETAASILLLSDGEGSIRPGAIANLIAVPWTGTTPGATPAETLVQLDAHEISAVIVSGRVHLATSGIAAILPDTERIGLEWISVDGVEYRVRAPIQWLMSETLAHLGNDIRLAGRKVSA